MKYVFTASMTSTGDSMRELLNMMKFGIADSLGCERS